MGNTSHPISTDLSDQVALVTGATSGLGRRSAGVLASCGARVALARRRVARLDEVARRIEAAISRKTEVLAMEWTRYHINVEAIAPGAFSSELMDGMTERVTGTIVVDDDGQGAR